MNNVLKVHDVQLITESPVHIGDGTKIEKKQYIYDPIAQKVKIVDLNCLYNHFHSIGRETAFTEFLLNRNKSLQNLERIGSGPFYYSQTEYRQICKIRT